MLGRQDEFLQLAVGDACVGGPDLGSGMRSSRSVHSMAPTSDSGALTRIVERTARRCVLLLAPGDLAQLQVQVAICEVAGPSALSASTELRGSGMMTAWGRW